MVCCRGDSLIGIALGVGINIVFHSTSVELLQLILPLLSLLNYFRQPALVNQLLKLVVTWASQVKDNLQTSFASTQALLQLNTDKNSSVERVVR